MVSNHHGSPLFGPTRVYYHHQLKKHNTRIFFLICLSEPNSIEQCSCFYTSTYLHLLWHIYNTQVKFNSCHYNITCEFELKKIKTSYYSNDFKIRLDWLIQSVKLKINSKSIISNIKMLFIQWFGQIWFDQNLKYFLKF